jgi:hypothetical protein
MATFIGTWDTTFQSSDGGWHPDFPLTVTESFRSSAPSGSVLHGMYDLRDRSGKMWGTLSGNKWQGIWENSPTETGKFTFNLGANDSFTGDYTYTLGADERRWPWNSTKLKRRHVEVKP